MGGLLEFKKIDEKPKTSVFEVRNKKSGDRLGTIKWMPHWRKYTFYPYGFTTLDSSCLKEISKFIDSVMNQRTTKSEAIR